MKPGEELVERARFLRNAAPIEFDKFKAAFARYAEEMAGHLVYATDNLLLSQGHAQQCMKIMEFLEKASRNG
jgi:hypothetical protein